MTAQSPAGPDPSTPEVHHLLVGPARHGVTRYGELLLRAADVRARCVTRIEGPVSATDVADLLTRLPAAPVPLHLHLTDHLFGGPEDTVVVVRALAQGRPLVVTLHDLPQPSDGAAHSRRAACYAEVARTATAVVVSSTHEQRLLQHVLVAVPEASARSAASPVDRAVRCRVVPLAGDLPRPSSGASLRRTSARPSSRDVAVLGFVYPGKGHDEVLIALQQLPPDVGLRVLGGASPGHEHMLEQLCERAERVGRRVTVEGWVPDEDLPRMLDEVAVPVVAPRHVSASASLASWLSAGRRPVATRNDYSAEVERAHSGSLLLVDDDPTALVDGLRAALADPASTRLATATGTDPVRAAAGTFDRVLFDRVLLDPVLLDPVLLDPVLSGSVLFDLALSGSGPDRGAA